MFDDDVLYPSLALRVAPVLFMPTWYRDESGCMFSAPPLWTCRECNRPMVDDKGCYLWLTGPTRNGAYVAVCGCVFTENAWDADPDNLESTIDSMLTADAFGFESHRYVWDLAHVNRYVEGAQRLAQVALRYEMAVAATDTVDLMEGAEDVVRATEAISVARACARNTMAMAYHDWVKARAEAIDHRLDGLIERVEDAMLAY